MCYVFDKGMDCFINLDVIDVEWGFVLDKFWDLWVIVDGKMCVWVGFCVFEIFWFNIGIFCNIVCVSCYIELSLINDCFMYFM